MTTTTDQRPCATCGTLFYAQPQADGDPSEQKYCSVKCRNEARRRQNQSRLDLMARTGELVDRLPPDEPGGTYVYLHQIGCLMCGRSLSEIRHPLEHPQYLNVPAALRCGVCGGSGYLTGDVVRLYVEERYTWPRPKVGRPPGSKGRKA